MNRLFNFAKRNLISGLVISLIGITSLNATTLLAADTGNGKILHDAKCFGCHDNRQYTRKNRIVHTYEDLRARVEFCDANLNSGFTFDEMDDLVAYLNTEFYKFKK